MKSTPQMQSILDFVEESDIEPTVEAIAFCLQLPEWSVQIDVEDMQDEEWVSLHENYEGQTVVEFLGY